jgi:hypothetical protein
MQNGNARRDAGDVDASRAQNMREGLEERVRIDEPARLHHQPVNDRKRS